MGVESAKGERVEGVVGGRLQYVTGGIREQLLSCDPVGIALSFPSQFYNCCVSGDNWPSHGKRIRLRVNNIYSRYFNVHENLGEKQKKRNKICAPCVHFVRLNQDMELQTAKLL